MLQFLAKRLKELHEVDRDERGFTLIELLVVIKVCTAVRRGHGGRVASAAYWTFSRDMVVRFGDLSGTGSTVFWVAIGVSGLVGGLGGDLVQRFGLTGAFRVSVLSMAAAIGLLAAAPGVLLWAYASAALFGSTYIMHTGIILVWSVSVFHERPSAGLGAAFLLIAVGRSSERSQRGQWPEPPVW